MLCCFGVESVVGQCDNNNEWPYWAPQYWSSGSADASEFGYITSFTLVDDATGQAIINTNGANECGIYSNYINALGAIDVLSGNTYTLTITYDGTNPDTQSLLQYL